MHVLIDFETGGRAHNGKLLNMAYTAFDMKEVEDIEEIKKRVVFSKLNFKASDQAHRSFDKDTLQWWKDTAPDLIAETFGKPEEGITLKEGLLLFADFLGEHYDSNSCLWARGTSFDITILDIEYERLFGKSPYPFWMIRDTRSFLDPMNIISGQVDKRTFSGKINGLNQKYVAHDPAYDVSKDVQQIQLAYHTYKG